MIPFFVPPFLLLYLYPSPSTRPFSTGIQTATALHHILLLVLAPANAVLATPLLPPPLLVAEYPFPQYMLSPNRLPRFTLQTLTTSSQTPQMTSTPTCPHLLSEQYLTQLQTLQT